MLGNVYNSQGNTEGAIGVLQALVEQYPDELGYRQRLANYYLGLERNDEAEAVLRESLAAAPDDLARQRALLEFLARTRGVEAAKTELDAMLQRQPDAARVALHCRQQLLLAANDGAGGGGGVPRNHPARRRRRAGCDQGAQCAGAADDCGKARRRGGGPGGRGAGRIGERSRMRCCCVRRWRCANRMRNRRSAISAWCCATTRTVCQAYRLLGQAHVQREEYALAQDALEKAIELAPTDPLAYLQLAEVQARSGDNDGAMATLERLLEQAPDNAAAQQAISRIQLSERDWQALAQSAQRIKTSTPGSSAGLPPGGPVAAAAGLARGGDRGLRQGTRVASRGARAADRGGAQRNGAAALRRGRAAHTQVLEANPSNVFARNLLGDVYLASGKIEQAVEQFEEAVRFHPKSPRAYARLAQVQIAQGDPAAARETLERGVEETGRSGYLVLQLAALLDRLGEKEAAEAAYEDVLARFPGATVAANNLAMLLATRAGDQPALDRALEVAQALRESDVPEFIDTLGWVYYLRGDYASALPLLEKAVAGKPEHPELRYPPGHDPGKAGAGRRGARASGVRGRRRRLRWAGRGQEGTRRTGRGGMNRRDWRARFRARRSVAFRGARPVSFTVGKSYNFPQGYSGGNGRFPVGSRRAWHMWPLSSALRLVRTPVWAGRFCAGLIHSGCRDHGQ